MLGNMHRRVGQTDDKVEGITAFLEKRKPDFHGR
jgi:1,4-dihydroxy-2-naphthoyl-CoA synthase